MSDKSKCDLCSDESEMLYTVESSRGKKYRLCKSCLKTVHEAYVEIE